MQLVNAGSEARVHAMHVRLHTFDDEGVSFDLATCDLDFKVASDGIGIFSRAV